jgi:hypothetical protein
LVNTPLVSAACEVGITQDSRGASNAKPLAGITDDTVGGLPGSREFQKSPTKPQNGQTDHSRQCDC